MKPSRRNSLTISRSVARPAEASCESEVISVPELCRKVASRMKKSANAPMGNAKWNRSEGAEIACGPSRSDIKCGTRFARIAGEGESALRKNALVGDTAGESAFNDMGAIG